jgi:hypothetical protein
MLSGCTGESTVVADPGLDPAVVTDRTLKEYDANGDKKLSRDELKKSPGLFSAIEVVDSNRDGSISSDELKAVLQDVLQGALVELSCTVTLAGVPLQGATVELVPESFLPDTITPASGVTDRDGNTYLSVGAKELPAQLRDKLKGVHCGIYRVIVTHPSAAIPARYNTQTELGRIVSRSVRGPLRINL